MGVQRKVVFEIATGTWCRYCPPIATAVEELKKEVNDTLIVVEYHHTDPFANEDSEERIDYYWISGYPTTMVDGIQKLIGAGYADSLRYYFDKRKEIPSSAEIEIERDFSKSSMTGTVKIKVKNVENFVLKGNLRTVITKTNIPYKWFNEDSLYFVARVMVPDPTGDYIEIEPESTVIVEHEFKIDPKWYEFTSIKNCEINVFLQTDEKYEEFSAYEILQGASIPVVPAPVSNFNPKFKDTEGNDISGLSVGDTTILILGITAENDPLKNLTGVLRSSEIATLTNENVVIIDSIGSWGDIEKGSTAYNEEDYFMVYLPPDYSKNYVNFSLFLTSENGLEQEDTLSLGITGIAEEILSTIILLGDEVIPLEFSQFRIPFILSIYDITGKKLFEKQFKRPTEKIKINKLKENGIYIIRVKEGKNLYIQKVIKMGS